MYLNELAQELANYTNSSFSDVISRAKTLRKHGIIDKGGHGPSARHVSLEDCVNLLLAVLINEKASDIHTRTLDVCQQPLNPMRQEISMDPFLGLRVFKGRDPGSIKLFEALIALMQDISSGRQELPLVRRMTVYLKQLQKDSRSVHKRITIDYFIDREEFSRTASFNQYQTLSEITDDSELLDYVDPSGPVVANKYLQSNFGDTMQDFLKNETAMNLFRPDTGARGHELMQRYNKYFEHLGKDNKKASLQEIESIPAIERRYVIGGQAFFILAGLVEAGRGMSEHNISYSMDDSTPSIMEDKPSIDQDFEDRVNELRKQRQSIRRDYMIENEEQVEHPFKVGRKYRREEIAGAIGSDQTIVGIFWGNKYPDRVVCTAGGAKAEKFGFQDRELDDGSWYYYGQGTKGDQSWNTSNQMVRDRKVWLFKTHRASVEERARGRNKNWYEFKGDFYCDNWENETPTSGPREGDQMIRFHLARE